MNSEDQEVPSVAVPIEQMHTMYPYLVCQPHRLLEIRCDRHESRPMRDSDLTAILRAMPEERRAKVLAETLPTVRVVDGGGWIPVGERVPTHNDVVLALNKLDGSRHVMQFIHGVFHYTSAPGEISGRQGHSNNITHWQPLPEPPR